MSDEHPTVPKYKREPLAAPPAHLLAGSSSSVGNGAAASPPVSPPPFKFDDKPLDNITDAIVNASGVLHRVLVQRINFHESEAKKLKAVLTLFAGSQPAANVAPSEGSLEELLRIAKTLEDQK